MNDKETVTNGASLEDCRTNVFPLADARGLHWKKFAVVTDDRYTRLCEDPVLSSYSNAIQQGILCSWQKHQADSSVKEEKESKLVDWAKELIIFWYGEEPHFAGILCPNLKEKESGCFEEGISNEYQALLFKSLHNLLERQLLGEKFFCNGRWFTKSCKKGCYWETLAVSFTFFIYGESLVVASVDVQKKSSIRCLSRSDLSDATSGDSVQVVLAPAGLKAVLTGQSLPSTDARAARILKEWERFYPVIKDERSNGFIPCLVEIVHSESKMLYPSCLVGVPVQRQVKKLSDFTQRTATNAKSNCESCHRKGPVMISALNSRIWKSIEPKNENKTPASNASKPETTPAFGPNVPLWDFKDRSRSTGCGCTSSTNVNRAKPLSRFGSSVSAGIKGASSQAGISTPSPSAVGNTQTANVNQRGRKERKKTSLPFHQRKSTNTERSPTPPITLSANMKTMNVNLGSVKGSSELANDSTAQSKLPLGNSPMPPSQNVLIKTLLTDKNLDQSYSSVPIQSISPTKSVATKTQKSDYSKIYKSNFKITKKEIDYVLPSTVLPKRPALLSDALEARSLVTDTAYPSLYVLLKNESEIAVSEVRSPISLKSANIMPDEAVPDGEVIITRMPNKGLKRNTEDSGNVDDATKKAKLSSNGSAQLPSYNASTPPPQSPAQSQLHSQADAQFHSQPINSQQSHTYNLQQQSQPQTQTQAKRGPGRPKKVQGTLYSPKAEASIVENGSILSPPANDKRRRVSSNSTKVKEEILASPPLVSNMKAASVKQRRRPSKKDHTPADHDMQSVTSPSARGGSVALSPAPFLPSPARTPGSTSSVSFTHSKDLTVNISDLDKLFEEASSDDEEELDNRNRIQTNAVSDGHYNQRATSNDDVFRTILAPAPTGLPHDLAKMFPTPPSQEPQLQATSPATSVPGDYGNPASLTHCHAVMSPEKHVVTFDKRYEELGGFEGIEGLESPFKIPQVQDFPVGDMFTPISVLPSMKKKSLKFKNPDSMLYIPTWKKNSRMPLVYQDKSSTKSIKLPFVESQTRTSSRTSSSSVNRTLSEAKVGASNLSLVAEKQKENIELNRIEITNQLPTQKEAISETFSTDSNETMSLEIALSCRVPADVQTSEMIVWPYDLTFKDDKSLIYNSIDDNDSSTFKEPRPKPPGTLNLPVTESPSDKGASNEGLVALPSRIAELFKEQWLSPFSVSYMTRILSVFYKVDFLPCPKTEVPPASSLGLFYELNPSIQNAFKKSLKKRSRELQKLEGPISFSSLHRMSGKNAVQSNLPVRPVLIGADGDYMSVAPNSLKSWRKLFLEPFSGSRDVAYVVVAPDSDLVLENTKQFFKELSMTYESMNLGKHGPIIRVLREGIIRVQFKVMEKLADEPVDDWFSQDSTPESIKMKLIAKVCKCLLGPHLASLELNRTLFDKSPAEERNSGESVKPKTPGANANSISGLTGVSSLGLVHEDTDNGSSNNELPAIVVYMIDPFQVSGVSEAKDSLWSLNGLIRAFAEMTAGFPDALKNNVFLQVVPLESILQLKASTKYHNGVGLESQDLQHLALSVYSSCRVTINSLHNGKICTGLGPGSLREKLLKKRQSEQQFPTRVFVPPFILAPDTSLIREDPHTVNDFARVMGTGEYNILFCSYCLSHDQSWVLVTCTDRRGEISDTTVIKILPQNRQSRSKKSPRKMALRRVLNFALDVISFFFENWRLVVHRLGNPGKGELKDLYDLSRKLVNPNQQKKRPQTPESCQGCRSTTDDKQRPTIHSITVATIDLEPTVKILPVNVKRKSISGSRIFVVPTAIQSGLKKKDRRLAPPTSLSLPLSQGDDLLSDSVFLMGGQDDDEQFMTLLPSPGEVTSSALLSSPHSDLVQQVFSPTDAMMLPHDSPIPTMSPFQPIVQNSPAFTTALSPLSMMPRPSSTQPLKLNATDDFARICRQPLCTGYIVTDLDTCSVLMDYNSSPLIKSDLLFHLSKNDCQLSKHPLDTDNFLELHRFILEQMDGLSWLNTDTATGKKHSPLASHIYLLTKFYETFKYFVT